MRLAPALLLCPLLLCSSSSTWAGGALDRFEGAHRPAHDSHDKPSSHDSSDDDDESSAASDDDSFDTSAIDSSGGSGGSDGEGDGAALLIAVCLVPPFLPACLHPAYRVAREPYREGGLYLEPQGDRGQDELFAPSHRPYLSSDEAQTRWAELAASGFRAFNEPVVYSHELKLTAWLGPLVVQGWWEHFYEQLEDSDDWDHLDRLGGKLGSNVLGPWVDFAELYLLAGASAMHGEAWTPAFDLELDLRMYPTSPLAVRSTTVLSVFGIGPLLLDTSAQAGVAFGPIEILAGARWLYQGEAQGFWGPEVSLSGRM